MEGQGNKALPEEKAPQKKGMTRTIAIVVVVILIIAAIGGALLLMGGKTTNVAPTASLIASPAVANDTTSVMFNASASQGQNGATIQYYLWNFGDGSPILNTTTSTVTHTYSGKPGLYQPVVTVVDSNGMSATSWATPSSVQVLVPIVPAETTNWITLVNDTTEVSFSASSIANPDPSNDTVLWYLWNFGDGQKGNTTTNTTTHTYTAEPGMYQITVKVVFDVNGNLSKKKSITDFANPSVVQVVVGPVPSTTTDVTPPTPITTVSAQTIENGTAVTFTGNGSLGYNVSTPAGDPSLISSVLWHFGDGSADVSGTLAVAGLQNHTYTGDGNVYVAWLNVTSDYKVTVADVTTNHTVTSTYYITIVVLPPATSIGNVKNPTTFTEATIGEPQTLDPAWDYETSGGEVLQNCYQTLVFYNGSSTTDLVPVLATQVPSQANGGISADGMNYTFNIRQGVEFQDGNVMTANDVVYSFERMLLMNSPEGPNWMYTQFLIPSAAKWKVGIDYTQNQTMLNYINNAITSTDTTVTFHLVSPCPAWLDIMAFQGSSITEKAWVQEHTGDQQYVQGGGNGYIDRNVMGTGPFALKTWAPNQYILLQRWDGYWGQKPSMQFVVIQKVQNVGSREEMLLTGQADSVYIPRQNMADVIGQPGVTIVQGQTTADIDFIGMTENISQGLDIGNIPATFFSDINVRQAFVHAFDYQNYLTVVLHGSAIQPNGPIPLGFLGYDPTGVNQTYNLSMTAAYLKLAMNPSQPGESYADTGFSIVLYYNAGNQDRYLQCQMMKTALESLKTNHLINGSISVSIATLDWPTYLNDWENKELPIFSLGWLMDYPDPDDFATPFCSANGVYAYFAGIDNATITNWTSVAAASLNSTLRVQLYHEITQAMYDNAYYIWTDQPTTFHVQRSWVHGYEYNEAFAGLIFSQYTKY